MLIGSIEVVEPRSRSRFYQVVTMVRLNLPRNSSKVHLMIRCRMKKPTDYSVQGGPEVYQVSKELLTEKKSK